jgi:glutamyl-tRNA synthetase
MSVLVRFAPSPTGYLHVGNARVALINALLAGGQAGCFVLRFDDTDLERSKDEYVQGIRRDLHWLGLTWQDEYFQSKRLDRYTAAAEALKASGRLYACYETPEELDYMRRRQRARGKPPIYDRSALDLTAEQIAAYEAEGRKPHWRFKLAEGTIQWEDLCRGTCTYDAAHLSDPVLIRADGTFLYMMPSAVDDAEMGITDVVRGEDHVTNTAVQIQLFEALGQTPPRFAHLPLLVDSQGQGLSKRLGSMSLGDLRQEGLEPMAVVSLLGRLGSSDAIEPFEDMDGLLKAFDIGHFGRSTPRFDTAELHRLNQKIIHAMPWEVAGPRLHALGLDHADEAFWLAVRGNLTLLPDAKEWYQVIHGSVAPVAVAPGDSAFYAAARSLLPAAPWDAQTWKSWTTALKTETGRKGKDLFMPLRRALTGHDHGPEMSTLLPLLGPDTVLARLPAAE